MHTHHCPLLNGSRTAQGHLKISIPPRRTLLLKSRDCVFDVGLSECKCLESSCSRIARVILLPCQAEDQASVINEVEKIGLLAQQLSQA